MKVFTNRKLIQKMTIVLVFLMLFNFIVPNYSRAAVADELGEKLVNGIEYLSLKIGDGVINVAQEMFIGTSAILTADEQRKLNGYQTLGEVMVDNATTKHWYDVLIDMAVGGLTGVIGLGVKYGVQTYLDYKEQQIYEDKFEIAMSPGKIFSGVLPALNIDFISSKDANNENDKNEPTWLSKYKEALNNLKEEISKEKDEDRLYALIFVYGIASAEDDMAIANKLRTWYVEMDRSYTDEKLASVIAPDKAFEDNKEIQNEIKNVINSSGLSAAVLLAGSEENISNTTSSYFAAKENSPAYVLHDIIATWYKIMRNIALIIMLSMLVYIGIRIMLTSTAADNAKYKKMLMDWVVAICLLLALHYLMSFTINVTQLITDAFNGKDEVQISSFDEMMNSIRVSAQNAESFNKFGYCLLYLVLIFYTIYFLFYYIKRVVYAAFLTFIAPFVAVTYPLDKMGDSKSQAFDMWVREYIFNAVIQPVHLIIYTVMITSAWTLAVNNPMYAIVVIGAMIPAEKFIKEMFGLNTKKGPNGGLLAGAATMTAMQRLAGRKPPRFGHRPGGSEGGGQEKTQTQEKNKKPKMADNKLADLYKSWNGNENENKGGAETPIRTTGTSPENMQDIDYEDFGQNQNEDNEEPETYSPGKLEFNQNMEDNNSDENVLDDSLSSNMWKDDEFDIENIDDNEQDFSFNAYNPISNDMLDNEEKNDSPIGSDMSNNSRPVTPLTSNDIPNNERPINTPITQSNKKSDKEKKKAEKRKLKLSKKAARRARNQHYKARDIRMLKNIGRGVAKVGFGAVTAGVAGTIGLAAGIASGDPSKVLQYTAAGAFAGSKIGANTGDGATNLVGGTVDFVKRQKEENDLYKSELAKRNENYREKLEKKENKKYAHSGDTKAAIRARMGYGIKDTEKMKNAMNFVETAMSTYGMRDMDKILNAYGLTQGVDAEGHQIGEKLDENQAYLVGAMAERERDRKSIKSEMRYKLADNIYDNGKNGKTKEDALIEAKQPTNDFMRWYDMGLGKNYKDAGEDDKLEDYQDRKDDAKRLKQMEEQARIQAEADSKQRQKEEAEKAKQEQRKQQQRQKEEEQRERKQQQFDAKKQAEQQAIEETSGEGNDNSSV